MRGVVTAPATPPVPPRARAHPWGQDDFVLGTNWTVASIRFGGGWRIQLWGGGREMQGAVPGMKGGGGEGKAGPLRRGCCGKHANFASGPLPQRVYPRQKRGNRKKPAWGKALGFRRWLRAHICVFPRQDLSTGLSCFFLLFWLWVLGVYKTIYFCLST